MKMFFFFVNDHQNKTKIIRFDIQGLPKEPFGVGMACAEISKKGYIHVDDIPDYFPITNMSPTIYSAHNHHPCQDDHDHHNHRHYVEAIQWAEIPTIDNMFPPYEENTW